MQFHLYSSLGDRYKCHKRYHFFTPKTILNVNKIQNLTAKFNLSPIFCSSLSKITLLTIAA